tara:strand:+ start:76969 stop:77931 length:963 start_codon:yes stop_codon:yes gene_type:complete
MKIWSVLPMLLLIGCSNGVEFGVGETSQNFAQDVKYNRKLDILFVIDNGSSMNLVQKQLHDQLPYLFDSLKQLDMDIHIATTSMTMLSSFPESGKLVGTPKYITMDTPNFVEELKKKIFIGENGSTLEEGLGAIEAVLSESYRKTEGKGFLRDDSFLNIIVLTNEDDKSAKPWNYYANFLDRLRPNHEDGTKSWTMNFFGVLSQQDNCSSSEWGFKEPGVKFMEVVNYSGGISGSLCGNDLYRSVSTIKARIIQILTDYKLDRKPRVDTIRVYVGGVEVPMSDVDGWTYVAESNLIRFNGTAIPGAEQGIRVDFLPDEAN